MTKTTPPELPADVEKRWRNWHGICSRCYSESYCPVVESELKMLAQELAKATEQERERIAEEYGDYRYIGQKRGFGRYEIGRALRFFLLPHTKLKKGDDENLT